MSLTLDDVQAILDRRRYRPGWDISAYRGDTTQAVMIHVFAAVDNSYSPGAAVPLHIYSPVPSFALDDELAFDKWLAWRLQVVEIHESQEWYRKPSPKDGRLVPVFNPHRDGADRDQWPIVKRED